MSFNSNVRPKDASGFPIEPGRYRVARGGLVRLGTVTEAEDTTLLVKFDLEERVQRVDELSQFCTWAKAEESEAALEG